MNQQIYLAVVHVEDNGFWAEIPDLGNCMADGDTIEETIAALRACAQLLIEYRTDEGKPCKEPSDVKHFMKAHKGKIIMPISVMPPVKAQRIHLTVPGHVLQMIDDAAKKEKSNRSDFMVRAARAAASLTL